MQLVDANVLLYAVNEEAPLHEPARRWLDGALSGSRTVGFAWIALLAFLRLATRPGVFPQPLAHEEAMRIAGLWLDQPPAVTLEPTARHLPLLRGLLRPLGTAVNLVSDAHLAALALEHDAELVSFDGDFARFDGVRWHRPD
ncbi:MAG TPA: TA system VapC family ribonuclease toxin [Thermoleophilaceae bacterium]|nr:TA system VapC family ribonuclease toxin [Thermoleophilaceae bacterium]